MSLRNLFRKYPASPKPKEKVLVDDTERSLTPSPCCRASVSKKLSSVTLATAATEALSIYSESSFDEDQTGVRFSLEQSFTCLIEPAKELPEIERDAIWYNKQEFEAIKGDNNLSEKLMQIGRENPENFGHCYRGLERRQAGGQRRRSSITLAIEAVLEEQRRQGDESAFDPELLAEVYQGYTHVAVDKARLMALKDEVEAL
eukprot:Nitzschia sp. Nitz4//scaffold26_size159584//129659//130264//NITZ4_002514-RA/size159584-processed-gene-0.209-mRNA-1//1//CDS//3329545151//5476//frame0